MSEPGRVPKGTALKILNDMDAGVCFKKADKDPIKSEIINWLVEMLCDAKE